MGPLPSRLRSRWRSSSPKFALRLQMPLLVRRVLPCGGLTWQCAFTRLSSGGDPCTELGLCKVKSALGDWTCDDCTDIMTRVAEFMKKEETIAQGIAVLEGECFCGAEGHTAD